VLELAERSEQLEQVSKEFEQYKLRAQSVLKQVRANSLYSRYFCSYSSVFSKFCFTIQEGGGEGGDANPDVVFLLNTDPVKTFNKKSFPKTN
jgi:hypothetical protein